MRSRFLTIFLICLIAPAAFAQTAKPATIDGLSPYDRAFKAADVDRDGRLSKDEAESFSHYRREYRLANSNPDGMPAIQRDANNDGTVSEEEAKFYRDTRRAYMKQLREARRIQRQSRSISSSQPRRSSPRNGSL